MESHSLLSHSMSESYIFVQLANTKTLKSSNSNHVIHFTTIFLLERKKIYSNSLNSMYFVQKNTLYHDAGRQSKPNVYQEKLPNIFSNFSMLCFVTAIGRCSSNIMAEETMEMVYLFLHNIKGKRKAFHIK